MNVKTKKALIIVIIIIVIVVLPTGVFAGYLIKRKFMKPTNLSQKGKDFIKQKEGLRLEAYRCAAGIPTIGYGHTHNVKMGDVITREKAEQIFALDIIPFETAVRNENLNINQNQFDALVSFAFNVGVGAFKGSTLLKKVKENPNNPAIKDEFAKWNKVGGVAVSGLTARRAEESKMYFS